MVNGGKKGNSEFVGEVEKIVKKGNERSVGKSKVMEASFRGGETGREKSRKKKGGWHKSGINFTVFRGCKKIG